MKRVYVQPAAKLQNERLYPVAIGYAAIVTAVTTYMLFKFDVLVEFIVEHAIGGGRGGVVAAVIVATAGVFALTYLLRMKVSPLMRCVGFVCSFLAPFGWIVAAWWAELHQGRSEAAIYMVVAHLGMLLALVSVWAIGLPFRPLKKRQ